MNPLTLIVPVYKTEKYIKNNIISWKEASKVFDVLFIQDGLEGETEKLANEIGAKFIKKENGNWGSVINFAKNKMNIMTEWVKVVDADDEINTEETLRAIQESKGGDLLIGCVNFIGKKSKKVHRYNNYKTATPFLHSSIIKTSLFKKTIDLPEDISFMDSILLYEVYQKAKKIIKSDQIIYKYYYELPGQSTDKKMKRENKLYLGYKMICDTYIGKVKEDAVKQNILFKLENVIWRTKNNKIYKDAYKKFWRSDIRGWFTNYRFMVLVYFFKRNSLDN